MRVGTISNLYYNTQIWFAQNVVPDLPNDDRIWAREYRIWLEKQGARLVLTDRNVLRNGLGVAPGYDEFEFRNEQDYLIFALRWG